MHLVSSFWQRWHAWIPIILLYSLIYWLSDQPRLPGPQDSLLSFVWFKTAHLVVYGTLGLLLFRAWRESFPRQVLTTHLWLTLIGILVLAGADEYHQSLVPGRTASLRDVGIDVLGTGVALWLGRQTSTRRARYGNQTTKDRQGRTTLGRP